MRFIIVIAVLAMVTGCAGPRQPDWTLGKSQSYPAESWLVGVGVDRDRGRAEDRARAEIAKIFQVEIRATDKSEESHRLSQVGKLTSAEYAQTVSAELTAKTNKILAGVSIAEVWQNPKTGEWQVLAALDRLRVARGLRSELQGIDDRMTDLVGRAEGRLSPPRRLGVYLQALRLADERRRIAADLRIVEPSGWVVEAPYAAHEIASRADRAAANLRIGLQVSEDQPAIVQGALVRALAEVGILQAPAADQNLVLRGAITTDSYHTGGPMLWSMASAQFELLDGEGTVLDSLRSSVREGSQISGRAEILAREKLGEKLAAQIIERLGYLGEKK
jgi:hypothetical protein